MTRKTSLLLLTAVTLIVALGACRRRVRSGPAAYAGRYGAPPPTAQAVGWSRAAPEGGGVNVQLPIPRPAYESHTERDDDGARRWVSTVGGENRLGFFAVMVVRWEGGIVGDPLPGAGELARSIFQRAEIPRATTRRLARAGFYGREDAGSNAGGAQVRLQQLIGADRVVLLLAVTPRDDRPAQDMVQRFFDSLQLDPQHGLFATPGTQRSDGAWTPLYLPESDFGIEMPVAPQVQEQELRIADRPATVSMFRATDGWGTYLVRVITFAGGGVPDEAFEDVRRRLNLQNRVRFVESSGYPGWVFTTDEDGDRLLARVYRTGSRIYVISARGPLRALRQRATQRRVLAYFNSFRIL